MGPGPPEEFWTVGTHSVLNYIGTHIYIYIIMYIYIHVWVSRAL